MYAFMLKKWFYHYWDNFLHFVIINILFLLSILIPLVLPSEAILQGNIFSILVLVLGILWLGVFTSAASLYVNEFAQYRQPEPKKILNYFKQGFAHGLMYAGLWGLVFFLLIVVLPFYSAFNNVLGITAMALVFWSLLFIIFSLQFYFPIVAQLDKRPIKILKKMFIIFMDNVVFTIVLFITSLIILIASGLTLFLFFGPVGLILLGHVGFKLRLYKYDYLEENPSANRRKIPWQVLIQDDQEMIGTRSFKNFIFPWKD